MSDEWMELPDGWKWTTLGETFNVYVGATPSRKIPEYWDGSIPWVSSGEVAFCEIHTTRETITEKGLQNTSTEVHPPGTILLGMIGEGKTRGQAAILRINAAHNQNSAAIRVSEAGLIPKYVYYFLEQEYEKTRQVSSGNNQPALNKSRVQAMSFPLAPLNEQKRIVAAIESLRERSQKARSALSAIPALCDKFRQSVLAAAFRGDLTADWREQNPDVEPASVLLERIKRDRQQKYLREIEALKSEGKNYPKLPELESIATGLDLPTSWLSVSVESACLFIIDCLHSTPKFVEEGEFCIDTTCIEPFKINWHKARKVSPDDFILRTSRMLPKQGDILFSREGTIGTAVRVPSSPKLCLGQRMMMFRFAPPVLPEYAEFFLHSPIFKNQYKPLILGTTSPHLNIGDVRKLSFLVPPISEQRQIIQEVTSLLSKAFHVEQRYKDSEDLLRVLDRSILAKAFRGELVEQDPNDEPASVLLERIRAEREQQAQGKAKKPGKKGQRTIKAE